MVKSNAVLTSKFGNYFLTMNRANLLLNRILNKHTMYFFMPFILLILLAISPKLYADNVNSIPPISGHAITLETINPADVLSRVNLATKQLEQIRTALNLPLANQLNIEVSEAQPREVYFQALAFYGRVNRFTFERLSVFNEEPNITFATGKALKPYHVWQITDRASIQLSAISNNLSIADTLKEQEVAKTTSPSDVFMALLQINRQLDVMLEQPYSPNDVYQQVTLGVHYMAKILSSYSVISRIPEAPEFNINKKPSDVWLLLADSFNLLRDVAQNYGEKTLLIKADNNVFDTIRPGDVYQYAALLVSELAYLHTLRDKIDEVVPTVEVTDKLPADVYQRVGVLHKQLLQLKSISTTHKNNGSPRHEK